jgi:hypothetical protein
MVLIGSVRISFAFPEHPLSGTLENWPPGFLAGCAAGQGIPGPYTRKQSTMTQRKQAETDQKETAQKGQKETQWNRA